MRAFVPAALAAMVLCFTACNRDPVGDLPVQRTMVLSLHPNEAFAGQPFNVQPNGEAAIAVQVRGLGTSPRLLFGGRKLDVAIAPDRSGISALVPAELYAKPGKIPVWIEDSFGKSNVKTFEVLAPARADKRKAN
jgi:hypothetical protein